MSKDDSNSVYQNTRDDISSYSYEENLECSQLIKQFAEDYPEVDNIVFKAIDFIINRKKDPTNLYIKESEFFTTKTAVVSAFDHYISYFEPYKNNPAVTNYIDSIGAQGIYLSSILVEDRPIKGINVLIIEDETFLRGLYEDFLKDEGYNVTIAVDGLEGAILASTNSYDLIWSGIMLPYMDGITVLNLLNEYSIQLGKYAICSNLAQYKIVSHAFSLGVDEYWVKQSLEPNNIITYTKELLNKKGPLHRDLIMNLTELPGIETYKTIRPKLVKLTELDTVETVEAKLGIAL